MLYPEKDSSDDVETLVDSLTAEGAHLSGLGISNLSHSHIQQLTELSQELQHTTMDTDEENEEEMTAEEITDEEEEDDEDEHELDEEEEEEDDDEEENEHENGELIEESQVEDHLMDTVENEVEIETEIQTDEQNRGAVESAENFLLDTVVKATSTATITMAESAVAITSSLASSLVTLTTTPAAAITTTSKQQQHNVSGGGGSTLPPLRPLTIIAPKPQQQQQQQQHNTSGGGSANTTTAALTKVPINMKPLQAGQQLLLVQGTGANQAIKLVSTSGGQELNLANFSFGGRLVSLKPATGGVAGSGNTVLKTLASNAQQNAGNSTNNAISLDQQQHHHHQPKPIMMKKLLTSASHQKLVMTSSSSSGATAGKSTFSAGTTTTLATNKQGQIICLQKSALSTGGTGNSQQSQQAGPQQIKLLPASQQAALNAALASPTKTITLQQAQEMGLIATKVMPQSSQLAAPGGGIQHQKQHTLLINKPGTKTIKIVPQVSGMATGTTQQLIATTASGQKIHLSQLKTQSKLLPISSGAITGTIGTASSQVTSNIGGGGTSGTAAATFITTSAAGGSNNNKIPTQRLIFKTTTATVANSNNNNIINNNNGSSAGGINTSSASGGGGSGAQNNNNNNINNNNSAAAGTTTTAVLPSGQILQLSNAQALGSGQLHQINIPGKGVQLIKFVQAPNPDTSSSGLTSNKSSIQTTLATPGGNIVLTEVKAGTTLTSKPLKTIAAKTSTISTPITPTNTIITPGGQVVMLPAYATAKVAIPTIRHHHSTPTKHHHNHNQNQSQQQSQQQAVAAQKTKEQQELMQQQKNGAGVGGGGNQMTSEAIMMQSHLVSTDASSVDANGMRPRKPCNCTKSQCLKLYCDCFANGEFCYMCNCMNCYNNLEYEDHRQRAIKTCLERNPHAFKPKIGKAKDNTGDTAVRKHTKGCNCKRSGCLKNYCECYEAKIACSNNCKCIGCRNIEDSLGSDKRSSSCSAGGIIGNSMGGIGGLRMMTSFEETMLYRQTSNHMHHHNPNIITTGGANKQLLSPSNKDGVGGNGGLGLFRTRRTLNSKQAINFITDDVIEATSQCMLSILDNSESNHQDEESTTAQIIQEFGSCMAEIIAYSTRHTHNNNNSNDHNK